MLSCFLCILLSSLAFLRVRSDLLSSLSSLTCFLTLFLLSSLWYFLLFCFSLSLLVLSLSSLSSLVSLWAITFGALGRSRLFGRTLILRVLALSISLGCSFLASSFVSLSLISDNLNGIGLSAAPVLGLLLYSVYSVVLLEYHL